MSNATDDSTPGTARSEILDAPADEASPSGGEVTDWESLLNEKQARIEELDEQTKRLSAEFENFRRRQQEEAKRRQILMKEELFRGLLPIVDNLDRSLEAAKSTSSLEALLKGVELIRRSFNNLFEEHQVVPIETVGQSFDPTLHEAMMVEERDDVPDQSIVMELQRGYRLGDRVLRPSMVKVSRGATEQVSQAAE